jgi:plastocyanin
MGLAVVWMADDTAAGGADPFSTRVDRAGVLTHGHLPENDNHGAQKTTLRDPRRAPDGASTSLVQVAEFIYETGDLAGRSPVPTVPTGSSITFENLDADTLSVWHSITACRAPCTKSTGIAYPIADADVQFDSGRLGDAGQPTVGRLTWETPSDLAPGTYTYFCRVHPFMRGAFRVTVAE